MSESNPSSDANKPSTSPKERPPLQGSQLKSARLYIGNVAFSVTQADLEGELKNNNQTAVSVQLMSYPNGRSKGCAIIEMPDTDEAAKAGNYLTGKELKGRTIYAREDREEKGFTSVKKTNSSSNNNSKTTTGGSSRGRGGFSTRGRGGVRRGAMSIFGSGGRGGAGGSKRSDRNYDEDKKEYNRGTTTSSSTTTTTNNNNNSNTKTESDGSSLFVGNISWDTTWQTLKDIFSAHGSVVRADVAMDKFTKRSRGYGTVKMSSAAEAEAAIKALNDTEVDGRNIQVRKDTRA